MESHSAATNMKFASWCCHSLVFLMFVQCVEARQRRLDIVEDQCPRGYYIEASQCVSCSPCPESQNSSPYYRSECRSYPYLCPNYNDVQVQTFQPLNFPSILGTYFSGSNQSWLLFFFEENSQATIGKLCLDESRYARRSWNTYQKTHLLYNGVGGEQFPELNAVRVHAFNKNADPMFFVLVSNDGSTMKRSAVCVIHLHQLTRVFLSAEFLDKRTGTILAKNDLPNPLGLASGNCPRQDDEEWLRDYPQMWTPVDCTEKSFEGSGSFIALETLEKRGRDSYNHKVIFVGTDDGRLLKLSWDGESFNYLMEMYLTNSSSIGISSLDIIVRDKVRELRVNTSDGAMADEKLQRCNEIKSKCVCDQDPFCHWSTIRVECLEFTYNAGEEEDSQPIIKKQCEGVDENGPLLIVDEFGRRSREVPVMTVTASHHVTEEITNQPEITELHIRDGKVGNSDGMLGWYILFLIGIALLVAVILLTATYLTKRVQYCRGSGLADGKEWSLSYTIDSTTIAVTRGVGLEDIKLCDESRRVYYRAIVEKGKIRCCSYQKGRVIFQNLRPSTRYNIVYCNTTVPVTTKNLEFMSEVDKNTYSINIVWKETLPEAFLVLRNEAGNYRKEKGISGHSVSMSELPSNMELTVTLEILSNSLTGPSRRVSTDLEVIRTREENFSVTYRSGHPFLEWQNLSPREFHLRLSSCPCVDLSNWSEDGQSRDGSKNIPLLPGGVMCHLEVNSTYSDGNSSFDHIIAEVDHQTPDIDGSYCVATLDAMVTLSVIDRTDVAKQMFLCETAVKVLLELLKSSADAMAYLTSKCHSPDDIDQILIAKKEQLKDFRLPELLIKLMELLVIETSIRGNQESAKRLFNVIETVVKRVHKHEDCLSCRQVLLTCRHLVNCTKWEKDSETQVKTV